MSSSVIQIKLKALENNLRFIRELVGPDVIISPVIKGNAYGHGIHIIVPALQKLGINHFSVFSSNGAKRAYLVTEGEVEIMIMGYIEEDDYIWVISNQIQFFVHEIGMLEKALSAAKNLGQKALIHLELETGMHRTGLDKRNLIKAVELINKNKDYIHVKGVTTHYAGAESIANHVRITQQYKLFIKRINWLKKKEIDPELLHSACSAAVMNYPWSRMDLVRVGIMTYGFWPTRETFIQYIHKKADKIDPLDRAIVWKSKLMSVNEVKESEFVGYGFGYQAHDDMKIGVVPVGYADGYSRSLSNNGHVLVNGQRADVIGTVNMNMIIINVTHLDDIKVGDEVILLGKQGDLEISVASFAEMNNSMNYELLTHLSERIERELV